MVVSLAREIKNGETVFHGVASPLPMVAILLAQQLHAKNAIYLNIPGGVNPRPDRLTKSTTSVALLHRAGGYFNLTDIFDLAARGGLDTAFLSGVQIDRLGRINTSVIGSYHQPKVRLPGGAGSAVLYPNSNRTILWRTKHSTKTFVENVEFVTSVGRLDKVITSLCIFKYLDGELWLDSIHPHSSLEEVASHTGFPIKHVQLTQTTPPTPEELRLLKQIDPEKIRELEFLS